MNNPDLSPPQIDDLVRRWFEQVMRCWEQRDMIRPRGKAHYDEGGQYDADPVTIDVNVYSGMRERARKALADNDFTPAYNIAAGILGEEGISVSKGSAEYRRLCRGILRAQVEYFRLAEAWRAGDFSITPSDPLFTQPATSTRPVQDEPTIDPRTKSMPLGELVEVFIETKIRDGIWKSVTARNSSPKLRLFAETLKNKPIDTVTRDDVRDWRDVLVDLDLANNTIRQHFSVVISMFNWAKDEGKCSIDSPLKRLAPPKEDGTRDAFTPNDLKVLFSSTLYTGHWREDRREKPGVIVVKDHKYWLPLVALHSGLRVEEAAKLTIKDVSEDEGVWFFHVKDAKTSAGNRIVPIHPMLIKLGILKHRDAVEKSGGAQLWPEIKKGSEGRFSQGFVQWWPFYRRSIGLDRDGLVFHSFRHTFISSLLNANVPEVTVRVLAGHSRSGVTAGVYGGKLLTPQDKLEAIQGVSFGADLAHLIGPEGP